MEKSLISTLLLIIILLVFPFRLGLAQNLAVDPSDIASFKNIKIAQMTDGVYYCLELTNTSLRKFTFKKCIINTKQNFKLSATSDKLIFKIIAPDKQSIILKQSFYIFPTDENNNLIIAQKTVNLCLTALTEESFISDIFSEKCRINPFNNKQKFELLNWNFAETLYKVKFTCLINGATTNSLSDILSEIIFTSTSASNKIHSGTVLDSYVEVYLTAQTYSISLTINTCEYFPPVLSNIDVSENSTSFSANIQRRAKCSDISGVSGCGWCPSKNKAMLGSASSPLNDTCLTSTDGAWTFFVAECPCLSMKTCSSISGGCGWCPSQNRAMLGNFSSPTNYSCPTNSNGVWTFYKTECPCLSMKTCSSISGNCGWCPSQNRAMLGTASSPTNYSCPTNSNGSWTFQKEECPCLNMNTCSEISGSCGWCPSKNKAMAGNADGPLYQSCPTSSTNADWTIYPQECKCFGITSCYSIISGCGWCDYLGKPMAGNTGWGTNAYYQNCSWKWVNHKDDCHCLYITRCSGMADTDCGWCHSIGQALVGGYGSPSHKTCSWWTWDSNDC